MKKGALVPHGGYRSPSPPRTRKESRSQCFYWLNWYLVLVNLVLVNLLQWKYYNFFFSIYTLIPHQRDDGTIPQTRGEPWPYKSKSNSPIYEGLILYREASHLLIGSTLTQGVENTFLPVRRTEPRKKREGLLTSWTMWGKDLPFPTKKEEGPLTLRRRKAPPLSMKKESALSSERGSDHNQFPNGRRILTLHEGGTFYLQEDGTLFRPRRQKGLVSQLKKQGSSSSRKREWPFIFLKKTEALFLCQWGSTFSLPPGSRMDLTPRGRRSCHRPRNANGTHWCYPLLGYFYWDE